MRSKPSIIKGKNGGSEVRFYYGVGGQRFMKTATANNISKTTYYIGKGYDEEIASNSSNEVKSTIYITVGGKTVGTHVETIDKNYVSTNANYKSTYNRYFNTDALGSITAITDDAGNVVERRSYEPFGKIRAMDYGLTSNHAVIPANTVTQTARAFTGHEQIGEISGLIHMNARVYDSDIGRFLSADTIIQDPHDSQAYNRYSYVRNNPLVFTDPSGHSWLSKLWKKVKKYIRTIVAIVVAAVIAIYLPELLLGPNIFSSMVAGSGTLTLSGVGVATVGAAAGFASGAIMTGSLSGALKGAAWGAVSGLVAFGIGEGLGHAGGILTKGVSAGKAFIKAAAHGLSRGIISMAQGGTFKSGFASGFSASFFSPGTTMGNDSLGDAGGFGLRTSIAAVVGGTASEIGGGKFSNGAVSGAFVHMFNAEGVANKISDGISYVANSVQFLAGGALSATGWGAVLGVPMMAHAANNLYETWTGEIGVLRSIEGSYYDEVDIGVSVVSGASGAMKQVGTRAVGYFGNGAIKGYAPVYNYSTTAGRIDLTVTGAGVANSLSINNE